MAERAAAALLCEKRRRHNVTMVWGALNATIPSSNPDPPCTDAFLPMRSARLWFMWGSGPGLTSPWKPKGPGMSPMLLPPFAPASQDWITRQNQTFMRASGSSGVAAWGMPPTTASTNWWMATKGSSCAERSGPQTRQGSGFHATFLSQLAFICAGVAGLTLWRHERGR